MHFDDRLATVLRSRVSGPATARIQFRQLLDLLGTLPVDAQGEQVDAACDRLGELGNALPSSERAAMLRDVGLRLRSPRLVALLANGESAVAAAAIERAQLDEDEWIDLAPALPVTARGMVRQRGDLGPRAEALFDRLGMTVPGLPPVEALEIAALDQPSSAAPAQEKPSAIGAIVQRIEDFRKARAPGEGRLATALSNARLLACALSTLPPIAKARLSGAIPELRRWRPGSGSLPPKLRALRPPGRRWSWHCVSTSLSVRCDSKFPAHPQFQVAGRLMPPPVSTPAAAHTSDMPGACGGQPRQRWQCPRQRPKAIPTGFASCFMNCALQSMRSRALPRSFSNSCSARRRMNTGRSPPQSPAMRRICWPALKSLSASPGSKVAAASSRKTAAIWLPSLRQPWLSFVHLPIRAAADLRSILPAKCRLLSRLVRPMPSV